MTRERGVGQNNLSAPAPTPYPSSSSSSTSSSSYPVRQVSLDTHLWSLQLAKQPLRDRPSTIPLAAAGLCVKGEFLTLNIPTSVRTMQCPSTPPPDGYYYYYYYYILRSPRRDLRDRL